MAWVNLALFLMKGLCLYKYKAIPRQFVDDQSDSLKARIIKRAIERRIAMPKVCMMRLHVLVLGVVCSSSLSWGSVKGASLARSVEVSGHHQPLRPALREIVIQASRTGASVSLWPGSAYSLADDALGVIKHRHIAESLVRVPGVWISRGNGQEHLTAIRSPVLTGAGACGAFLMAEDGIPLRAAGFCNVNQLFEATSELAARLEVLSGPQSVLYGTNALHGVINVVSPMPDAAEGSVLSLEAGSHDYFRTTLLHNAGQKHQHWSVAFNGVRDGGDKDDAGFDQQKLKLRHSTRLTTKAGDLHITASAAFTNLNQETAGFIRGNGAYRDGSRKKANPNPEAYRDASSQRISVNIEYASDDKTSWRFTPYLRHTRMEFLMHFLPWQPRERNSHASAGWQAAIRHRRNDQWTLHAGLDGEYTQGKLEEIQADGFSSAIPAGAHYDYEVDAAVISPFASVHWQASAALSVSAGLRYEWLSYDYENKAPGSSPCADNVACRFARPDDTTDDFNNASWQWGVLYRLSPSLSAFTKLSRAYRAPQTTELYRLQAGQLSTDLDAETIDSVEIGLRGNYRDWRYSLAVYRMQKDDVIFQDTERQTISGASTQHRGVDLLFGWSAPSGPEGRWYATLNASYAKHRYDSNMAISDVDISGNDIDTAPRYMGSLQLGNASQHTGQTELEWVYMGNYYTDPENAHSYRGHRLVNLRWQWRPLANWQVGVRLNNILNEDYADRADFGFGDARYFVGASRTGFIELTRQL